MELFTKFRDTVFLKEDSDLEKQLEQLKSIRTKLKDTTEIDKDIKILEYGIYGEKQLDYELRNAHIGMYVLHDVTFECDGNKAQIDYLVFTRGFFYLIECKNLIGNITVDSNGQFYREYEYNGKKIKEGIYSPYTQARRHQDLMKKVWAASHSKLDNILFGGLHGKDFFRPIVVLANSKSFLNKKYAPKEIRDDIIRADQLVDYIQKDINTTSFSELINEKTLRNAAETWLSRSVVNNTNKADKYLNKISEINSVDLENELRQFRKDRAKERSIPPYYVFNDEEMNAIIKAMPKNIEELQKIEMLSDIKIKCHGEEIIKIINGHR